MFVKAIIEKLDYYPFGMEMPERTNFTQDWRFGYQGLFAERDGLTGKNDFMLRQYDSRLARWKTKDPMGQYASPYMAMGNNPVSFIDPSGGYDYLEESEKRNQKFFDRSQKDFWGEHIPGAMAAYSADNTAIDMDAMGVEAMKNYYNIMYGVSENNSWAVIGELDPSFQNWENTDGTNNSTSSFDLTFIGLDWLGDYQPGWTDQFSSEICLDCLDKSTVGRNIFGLAYTGSKNPKSYNGKDNFTHIPTNRADYPSIGHDRRYTNLGINGAGGLIASTKSIGADWRFVIEELSISLNPSVDINSRITSFIVGGGLGAIALPKTVINFLNPYGLQESVIWYNASNIGVTNNVEKQ